MASHNPSFIVVVVVWEHFIKSSSGFRIVALANPDSGFGVEVLSRMEVLDIFKSNISSFEQIVFQQQIHQLEEDLVAVIWLHLLVSRRDRFPVDDFNLVLNSLCSEVLWSVILWLELIQFSHSFHFGNSKVLPGETRSSNGFIHEAHE